jgi:hypothetical protein
MAGSGDSGQSLNVMWQFKPEPLHFIVTPNIDKTIKKLNAIEIYHH